MVIRHYSMKEITDRYIRHTFLFNLNSYQIGYNIIILATSFQCEICLVCLISQRNGKLHDSILRQTKNHFRHSFTFHSVHTVHKENLVVSCSFHVLVNKYMKITTTVLHKQQRRPNDLFVSLPQGQILLSESI